MDIIILDIVIFFYFLYVKISLRKGDLIMTKKLELYRCSICGNIIEVVISGAGELVCCNQPMLLLNANTTDAANEKHVPFFVKKDDELEIRIGSVLHPMVEEHYIQFIEAISQDEKYVKRKYLHPGEEPIFKLKGLDIGSLTAKEYCNIHGLWEAKND